MYYYKNGKKVKYNVTEDYHKSQKSKAQDDVPSRAPQGMMTKTLTRRLGKKSTANTYSNCVFTFVGILFILAILFMLWLIIIKPKKVYEK